MNLPSIKEAEQLHKKYAPNADIFEDIWQHCLIVREISLWCLNNTSISKIDKRLVEAGCLIHDIGVYKLYVNGKIDSDNYLRHGILGYEILTNEGFDEKLCRFTSHHTGVGITAQEIVDNNLPLPVNDYQAKTDEERLVMYADKFHSKHPLKFNSVSWIKSHLTKFGKNKVELFEKMITDFGVPPITKMAEIYK